MGFGMTKLDTNMPEEKLQTKNCSWKSKQKLFGTSYYFGSQKIIDDDDELYKNEMFTLRQNQICRYGLHII